MKAESVAELLQLARRAPRTGAEEAPPFFAQRVAANWLSIAQERSANLWERFAVRGAAVSFAAVILAFASTALVSDYNDDPETDDAVEIFTLP